MVEVRGKGGMETVFGLRDGKRLETQNRRRNIGYSYRCKLEEKFTLPHAKGHVRSLEGDLIFIPCS